MVDVMILKKFKCGESGQYGLTCTPFGLRNADQSFQCFMDEVLEGLEDCLVCVDDMLIWRKSLKEHELHLHEVLSRMAS